MTFIEFDFVKQYSTCLMEAPFIPSISPLDRFQPYDGHQIQDKYLYTINLTEIHPIYSKNISLIYGFILKRLLRDATMQRIVRVVAFIPLIIHSNKLISQFIKNLYEDIEFNEVKDIFKKGICNQGIGKTLKKYNTNRLSSLYKNVDDANMHLTMHKGAKYPLDTDRSQYYLVNNVRQTALIEGFLPIGQMVLDMARYKMFELCQDLMANNLHVVAMKTDAVFIERDRNFDIIKNLPFYQKWVTNHLGGVRMEDNKLPPDTCIAYKISEDDEVKRILSRPKDNTVRIHVDEISIDELKTLMFPIIEHKQDLIDPELGPNVQQKAQSIGLFAKAGRGTRTDTTWWARPSSPSPEMRRREEMA
jgi:hypothetical protein